MISGLGLGLGLETSGLGLGLGLEALGLGLDLGLEAFGLGLGLETPSLVNIPDSWTHAITVSDSKRHPSTHSKPP